MKNKKAFVIFLIIVFAVSVSAQAKNFTVDSTFTYKDIKIFVDDNEVITEDEPFIYKGRTYVPARAVAEAMGGSVYWDEESRSVKIYNDALLSCRIFASGTQYASLAWDHGRQLESIISDLIDRRNDTVLYKSSNYSEILSEKKERFEQWKKDWGEFSAKDSDSWQNNEQPFTASLQLAIYNANQLGKNIPEDKLNNAINSFNWAADNIAAAHAALDKYDINNDTTYLQEYAVHLDNAQKNKSAGMNILDELEAVFIDCIYML